MFYYVEEQDVNFSVVKIDPSGKKLGLGMLSLRRPPGRSPAAVYFRELPLASRFPKQNDKLQE